MVYGLDPRLRLLVSLLLSLTLFGLRGALGKDDDVVRRALHIDLEDHRVVEENSPLYPVT